VKLFEKQQRLKLDDPNWAIDPELAVIDTILETYREFYDAVRDDLADICKDNGIGRKDTPTVEQILRAAIYKEIKHLNYRELEYAEWDSKICREFIRIYGRECFSFQTLQKYISVISSNSLKKVMTDINKIAIEHGLEDGKRVATDSTIVETNIQYPTNNELVWDCIVELNRLFKDINRTIIGSRLRHTTKQAKKNYYKINVTKKKEERKNIFVSQLEILKRDIKRAKKTLETSSQKNAEYMDKMQNLVGVSEKVYNAAYRHEILEEQVPNSEKTFSIYEQHTDIIVKGSRTVKFGHKVNLSIGKSNLILDCSIPDGNPKDTDLYQDSLQNVKENYGVQIHDITTDGGYASKANADFAKGMGIVNIVFTKVVGSLKNIVTSKHIETKLEKWRSTIEAVISNVKRGFDMRRCEWKGRAHFDSKVFWSVIAYNIRVITSLLLKKLSSA
jgi:transposase, IS5 family